MSFVLPSLLVVTLSALTVTPTVSAQLRAGAVTAGVVVGMDTTAPPITLSATVDQELFQISQQAGVIFAGQVLAVRPHVDDAWGSGSGWVEIEFRIDEAVRGCAGQATYTLREWSGLWAGGRQRYTVGQNLLMLLHTPSASGLSSPVGGQEGMIPLTGAGAAPGPRDRFVGSADNTVDLRWVEARLLRPDANVQRMRPSVREPRYSGKAREAVQVRDLGGAESPRLEGNRLTPGAVASPITVPMNGTIGQGITLRGILSLLMAWEAEQNHAAH